MIDSTHVTTQAYTPTVHLAFTPYLKRSNTSLPPEPYLSLQGQHLVPKEVRLLLRLPQILPQPLHLPLRLHAPFRVGRGRRRRRLRLRRGRGRGLQVLGGTAGVGCGRPSSARGVLPSAAVNAADGAFRTWAAGSGAGPLHCRGQRSTKHGHDDFVAAV